VRLRHGDDATLAGLARRQRRVVRLCWRTQAARNALRVRAEHQRRQQQERWIDAESLGVLYSIARAA